MNKIFALATVVGAFVEPFFARTFGPGWGWRACLFVSVVPAVLVIVIRQFMPESDIWEEYRRQGKKAGGGHDFLVSLRSDRRSGVFDAVSRDVPLVAELNRLFDGDVGIAVLAELHCLDAPVERGLADLRPRREQDADVRRAEVQFHRAEVRAVTDEGHRLSGLQVEAELRPAPGAEAAL